MLIRFISVVCGLPMLTACVGMSLGAIEASSVAAAGASAAALAADKDAPFQTEIRGTYEDGFWFDRNLFSVWVISESAEEAKRVALDTATNACAERSKPLKIIKTWDWQERQLFVPVKIERFSFEIRFRCEPDAMKSA